MFVTIFLRRLLCIDFNINNIKAAFISSMMIDSLTCPFSIVRVQLLLVFLLDAYVLNDHVIKQYSW